MIRYMFRQYLPNISK